MFIYKIRAILSCTSPAVIIALSDCKRSRRIDYLYIRIFCTNCLMKIRITFEKSRTYLLVPYSDILKSEGVFMPKPCPYGSPLSLTVSIGKFNQIQCIIYPFAQLVNRYTLPFMRIKTSRKHRKRLSSYVFTKTEIFVISESECLIISPVISP